jgi:hypothetical protein
MSYDLHIGHYDFNYTWNLGKFFRDYIKYDEKEGLEALSGLTGKQSYEVLSAALKNIKSASYKRPNGIPAWQYFSKQYDPDNYWGDVMSATLFIAELMIAANDNKRKKWSYST